MIEGAAGPREAELLADAALARELAPESCAPTGCAWYHSAWPLLRALGLVASPERHRGFFSAGLGEALTVADEPRILVAGAADAGMLDIVMDAGATHGVTPRVTVLDRCATPVQVCEAHAQRARATIDAWVGDVVDVDAHRGFDAVCTHGLLSQIPSAKRLRLAGALVQMLRPGGCFITTIALSGGDAGETRRFSPEEVQAFAAGAKRAADARPDLGIDANEAESRARGWAEGVVSFPIRDTQHVTDVLARSGLQLSTLDVRTIAGQLDGRAAGPWTARLATYAEVIACATSGSGA